MTTLFGIYITPALLIMPSINMLSQNKILLKQTLLLASIPVLFFLLGSFASYDGPEALAEYRIFYVYFFLMIILFVPILIFYYGLLKNKNYINLRWLNIAFKLLCWPLILTLSAFFISGIHGSSYMTWTGLNFFASAWYSIKLINMDGITNFLYYTPDLILAGLLYWAIRINKSFNIGIANN